MANTLLESVSLLRRKYSACLVLFVTMSEQTLVPIKHLTGRYWGSLSRGKKLEPKTNSPFENIKSGFEAGLLYQIC